VRLGELDRLLAVGGIRHGALEHVARRAAVHRARRAAAVDQHAARLLGHRGRDQARGAAVRADQQLGARLLDQLAVQRRSALRLRAVVEDAHLHAAAEQPARCVDFVLPQQQRPAVVGGELGQRARLRDHGADDERFGAVHGVHEKQQGKASNPACRRPHGRASV
jgi:hypothetical protein